MKNVRWLVAGMVLLSCALARADEEDAVRVYRQLKPSVVSLQNAEGSGTGILLNAGGLILTNAHVVSSPLPFKVKIDLGNVGDVTFSKVQIVGYHPRLDLALVKIDPAEQHAHLTPVVIGPKKAEPGQRIYVIGDPGAGGMILTKTITSGMISGVDREVEGEKYYQTDAAINPGNSGGPICDRTGHVLGMVTFKFTDVEATAFAIPLYNVDLKSFVPLIARKSDPQKASRLVKLAEKYADLADQVTHREGFDSPDRKLFDAYAAICYRDALVYDPANPAIFYSVGMLLRTLDENETAAGYLTRAVELEPWDTNDASPYRELGFSLVKAKHDSQALTAWLEGVSKSPYAAKIWEDLAIYYQTHAQYAEAATSAATAILVAAKDTRVNVMEQLENEAKGKLSGTAAQTAEQQTTPKAIIAVLDKMLAVSNAARLRRQLYITAAFVEFMKSTGGAPTSGVEQRISTTAQPRLKVLDRYADGHIPTQTTTLIAGNTAKSAGGGWVGPAATPVPSSGHNTIAVAKNTPAPTAPGGWIGGASTKSPTPQITGSTLGRSHKRAGDASVTVVDAKDVVDVEWSADGKFAFILEKEGLLHKMAIAHFTEERQLAIGSLCTALGRSKQGLIVAVAGMQETWVLSDNLEVLRRITTPGIKQLVGSPAIPLAYASSGGDSVSIIDLVSGETRQIPGKQFETDERGPDRNVRVAFWHIGIAPDGRYLFAEGNNVGLMRFRIAGRELLYDGASPVQADNVKQIAVSADSRYVAVLAGAGNNIPGMSRTPYATYVFAVEDLTRPATIIESGAYPQAMGFDVAAHEMYAQNFDKSLIVFAGAGLKGKEYKISKRGSNVHRFVVHPDGHKLFVVAEELYWVELP